MHTVWQVAFALGTIEWVSSTWGVIVAGGYTKLSCGKEISMLTKEINWSVLEFNIIVQQSRRVGHL